MCIFDDVLNDDIFDFNSDGHVDISEKVVAYEMLFEDESYDSDDYDEFDDEEEVWWCSKNLNFGSQEVSIVENVVCFVNI